MVHLTVLRASSRRSMGSISTRNSSQYGLLSLSGSKRLMRISTFIRFSFLVFALFGLEYRVINHLHSFEVEPHAVGFGAFIGQGVLEPVGILAGGAIGAVMSTPALSTRELSWTSRF